MPHLNYFQRRTTLILSPGLDASFLAAEKRNTDIIESFAQKTAILLSLRSGVVTKILNLLVALSGMLSPDDYREIGPLLWRRCLASMGSQALASVRLFSWFIRCPFTNDLLVGMLLDNAMCREDYKRFLETY